MGGNGVRVGGNCYCAGLFFKQEASAGTQVRGLDQYYLCGVSHRTVGDELGGAMQLPWQPPQRLSPSFAQNRRQHYESATRLPAHRQLRVVDLPLAATDAGLTRLS